MTLSSIGTGIYKTAAFYTNSVETGATLAYYGADGAISCIEGIFSTTATGWNLGLKNSLKECVKWSLGSGEFQKAAIALRTAPPTYRGTLVTRDERSTGHRIGECIGHVTNGTSRAVTSGVVATGAVAALGGSISNAMQLNAVGEFHVASQLLAKGALGVSRCLLGVGLAALETGANATLAVAKAFASNPQGTVNLVGAGGTLYFTSLQIVKLGNAKSYTRKSAHLALATLGLCATALVPLILTRAPNR